MVSTGDPLAALSRTINRLLIVFVRCPTNGPGKEKRLSACSTKEYDAYDRVLTSLFIDGIGGSERDARKYQLSLEGCVKRSRRSQQAEKSRSRF